MFMEFSQARNGPDSRKYPHPPMDGFSEFRRHGGFFELDFRGHGGFQIWDFQRGQTRALAFLEKANFVDFTKFVNKAQTDNTSDDRGSRIARQASINQAIVFAFNYRRKLIKC